MKIYLILYRAEQARLFLSCHTTIVKDSENLYWSVNDVSDIRSTGQTFMVASGCAGGVEGSSDGGPGRARLGLYMRERREKDQPCIG